MKQLRTIVTKPEQSKHNGKWAATFENWNTCGGEEYLASSVSSPPLFETEQLAFEAAGRALVVLEETGRYPNMCEAF